MQTRAIEVAMSLTNTLLKRVWLFIDAMSVHSQFKCFQVYKNIFFILMVKFMLFVTIVIWAFIGQKYINSFNNNTRSTCYKSCLCWLSYYKCRCGCWSGWCACRCLRRNQRHKSSKKWVSFFGVLETYVIGGNQPTDENQSIDLLRFMWVKKIKFKNSYLNVLQKALEKFSSALIWVWSNTEQKSILVIWNRTSGLKFMQTPTWNQWWACD